MFQACSHDFFSLFCLDRPPKLLPEFLKGTSDQKSASEAECLCEAFTSKQAWRPPGYRRIHVIEGLMPLMPDLVNFLKRIGDHWSPEVFHVK